MKGTTEHIFSLFGALKFARIRRVSFSSLQVIFAKAYYIDGNE